MNDQTKVLLLYLSVGLSVLSARIVMLLAMAMTFALFAFAMYAPTWERIAGATIFAALIFIPATRIDKDKLPDRKIIAPEGE